MWIPRGVHLDETDGHVDNLARFVAPGVVVLTWTHDTSDPQYERSAEALDVLRSTTDARGRALEVVLLHQPGPLTITPEEAGGLDVSTAPQPRPAGGAWPGRT